MSKEILKSVCGNREAEADGNGVNGATGRRVLKLP